MELGLGLTPFGVFLFLAGVGTASEPDPNSGGWMAACLPLPVIPCRLVGSVRGGDTKAEVS
jgi:hypothetical protein